MPSFTFGLSGFSPTNSDKAAGATFSCNASRSIGALSGAYITGASFYISNINVYISAGIYFDVNLGGATGRTGSLSGGGNTSFSASDGFLTVGSGTMSLTVRRSSGSGTGNVINIRNGCTGTITINYELSFSAPSTPTGLYLSANNVAPNTNVTLGWNASSGGTNNPVSYYQVLRNGTSIGTTSSTSFTVASPSSNGSFSYTVQAIGANGSSGVSSAVTLTTQLTAPSITSTYVNGSDTDVLVAGGSNVALTWNAQNGVNNNIQSYNLLRNGTAFQSGVTNGITVPANSAGNTFTYSVVPVGAFSNGAAMNFPVIHSYADPSAPTVVNISTNLAIQGSIVTLSWSGATAGANNAITGYRIVRATSLNGTYTEIATVTETSYQIEVESGVFFYRVVTQGAASNSNPSNAHVSITGFSNVVAPSSVTLSVSTLLGGTSATLSWSNAQAGSNNPIVSYTVFSYTNIAGNQNETNLGTVTTTATSGTLTVTALAGVTYYYRVRVNPTNGTAVMSNVSSTGLLGYATVLNPTVSLSRNIAPPSADVTLSWQNASAGANNDITGYEIYQGAALLRTVDALTSDTVVQAPAVAGNNLVYRVVTVGQHNKSLGATITLSSFGASTAPSNLTISAATASAGTDVTLSWSGAVAGALNPITGFIIYRSEQASANYTVLKEITATLTSGATSVSAPVEMGKTYYFRVATKGTHDESTQSARNVSVTSSIYSVPNAPSVISFATNEVLPSTRVVMSWSGAIAGTNNPITGYTVYQSTEENGAYTELSTLTTSATSSSLQVTAPSTFGASLYFKIVTRGTRVGFIESEYSSPARLYTISTTACTPPSNLRLNGGTANLTLNDSATLSWSAGEAGIANLVTGYLIEERVYGSSGIMLNDWRPATNLAGETSSATNSTSALSITVYCPTVLGYYKRFRVRTTGSAGSEWYSAFVESSFSLIRQAYTVATAPTTLTLSASLSEGDVTFSWSGAVAGANNTITGYAIQFSESTNNSTWGNWTDLKTVASTATSASTSVPPSATRGSYRRFRVRTNGSAGADWHSVWSNASSSVRRNSIPPAPTIIAPINAGSSGSINYLVVRLQADPDTQSQQVSYNIKDSGNNTVLQETLSPVFANSELASNKVIKLPSLNNGTYTLSVRSKDSMGAFSATATVTFVILSPVWSRTIATGTVISNQTISHKADITEMANALNNMRRFYGLAVLTVPTSVLFKDWSNIMISFRTGINDVRSVVGLPNKSWVSIPRNYPNAAVINDVRNAIKTLE